jgi:hypothetical protein
MYKGRVASGSESKSSLREERVRKWGYMLFIFETNNRLHSQCLYPCVTSTGLSMEAPPQANLFPSSYKTRVHQGTMVDPDKMVDIRHNFKIIIVFTLHRVTILFCLNDLISGFLLGSNSSQSFSQVHISGDCLLVYPYWKLITVVDEHDTEFILSNPSEIVYV